MPTLTAIGTVPSCVLDVRLNTSPRSTSVLSSKVLRTRYPKFQLDTVWYVLGRIDGAVACLRRAPELAALPQFERLVASALSKSLMLLADLDPLHLTAPERALLRDALAARNAAIEGDHAMVDAFASAWLGLRFPARWRAAVEMALLGEWVTKLGTGRLDDTALIELMQQHAHIEHRHLQPLWERRVRGKRVDVLSRPVGDGLTLADVVSERCTPETLVVDDEFQDRRITAVLGQLAAPEAEMARAWAYGNDPWPTAAALAGHPARYGERVRTKLKRLGERHTTRAAEATARGWEPA
ncbi:MULTISPECIES: hypothetical protein [Streptomyces]|uniref:Uncharacterized protein n=1 Tax=Streptomyces caniferus TaxID=285557 RepID=A0ABZ1VVV6_9ACTN|nr:hypothetical protein [Streptomyces caniferus]WSV47609.1 hypothetical protein OG532_18075 [Streptomyces decoyicus]